MNKQKWRGSALLCAFSVFVAFALGELVVRALDIPPRPLEPLPWDGFRLSSSPILRWEHEPNTSDHRSTINSAGFADSKEYSLEKGGDTIRIVVIGDSVTAFEGGTGGNWTEVLEEALNSEADKKIELINMAVGGYDTYQQVEFLKLYGMKYRPDFVLVGFCIA